MLAVSLGLDVTVELAISLRLGVTVELAVSLAVGLVEAVMDPVPLVEKLEL